MTTYIYLPFATEEAREMARVWSSGREKKRKEAYEVIERPKGLTPAFLRRLSLRVLARVGATDKLYILAHGASRTSGFNQPAVQIGMDIGAVKKENALSPTWEGGVWKGFEAHKLAEHLEAEGLTRNILDVRVFACGTGISSDTVPVAYAKLLREALRRRGYRNVTVSGYNGDVAPTYNNRTYVSGVDPQDRNRNPNLKEYTANLHKGVRIDRDHLAPAKTGRVPFK